MEAIRAARQRCRISQRRLAERAGLSFRGVQLLEADGHDARLSSLEKAAVALGLPRRGLQGLLEDYFVEEGRSFRSASIRMLNDGIDSWTIHLFDAVDAFRARRDPDLIRSPPVRELAPRLQALIASTVDSLCDEATILCPGWCCSVGSLDDPWFVSGVENLKASALVESPVHYRKRKIFVLANFLERV